MDKIEKITKQQILNREWNKFFERKVMLEFEIALQRELNPEEKSAKKPIRFGANGQPVSWEEITRKEYISILENELEAVELKLKIIQEIENK